VTDTVSAAATVSAMDNNLTKGDDNGIISK
jgi:hypothetical protein